MLMLTLPLGESQQWGHAIQATDVRVLMVAHLSVREAGRYPGAGLLVPVPVDGPADKRCSGSSQVLAAQVIWRLSRLG